jgi:hypothetical protein
MSLDAGGNADKFIAYIGCNIISSILSYIDFDIPDVHADDPNIPYALTLHLPLLSGSLLSSTIPV